MNMMNHGMNGMNGMNNINGINGMNGRHNNNGMTVLHPPMYHNRDMPVFNEGFFGNN